MAEWDRERQGRQSENDSDWDWYYYEYRYEPYPYGDRERYGRNFSQNYGRGQDFGRNYSPEYGQNYGRNYGQGYGRGSENDFGPYGSMSNWNHGRYTGVGPRGYKRSDNRIMEDVNDRLTWHGQIDATDIQADVKDGVVTLSGSVNSRYEKRMAEEIAESVSGVTDVQNNLKINNQTSWNQGSHQSEMNQQTQGETADTSRKRR